MLCSLSWNSNFCHYLSSVFGGKADRPFPCFSPVCLNNLILLANVILNNPLFPVYVNWNSKQFHDQLPHLTRPRKGLCALCLEMYMPTQQTHWQNLKTLFFLHSVTKEERKTGKTISCMNSMKNCQYTHLTSTYLNNMYSTFSHRSDWLMWILLSDIQWHPSIRSYIKQN